MLGRTCRWVSKVSNVAGEAGGVGSMARRQDPAVSAWSAVVAGPRRNRGNLVRKECQGPRARSLATIQALPNWPPLRPPPNSVGEDLALLWFWAVVGAGRAGSYPTARADRWPPGVCTITRTGPSPDPQAVPYAEDFSPRWHSIL